MKNKLIIFFPLLSVSIGCTNQNSFSYNYIKEASKPINASYSDFNSEGYKKLLSSLHSFSSEFLNRYYLDENDINKNFAISPLSMYYALAMAVESSGGNTRNELLNALNISYDDLKENIKYLYSFSNYEDPSKSLNNQHYIKQLTNSIWLSKDVIFKDECISSLADLFYASSFKEDFLHDNKNANERLSKYVSEKTHGLIKHKFELGIDTLFVLLNTLYLQSAWNQIGKPMPKSEQTFNFKNADNSFTTTRLLHDTYTDGRILKEEKYSSYRVTTNDGIRIKFILPNEGYSLDDVMNKETFDIVNKEEYNNVDLENNKIYYTETYFPEYEADSNFDASELLQKMGVKDLFSSKCDFSTLTDIPSSCSGVIHSTKLKVDDLGIEGAAFTAVIGATSSGPSPLEEVYETFTVDKSFGYIIYDWYESPLFAGAVNKI